MVVFDKNVDGLVHYLEILSDDIFYYSRQKPVLAAGLSFINISLHTLKRIEFKQKTHNNNNNNLRSNTSLC